MRRSAPRDIPPPLELLCLSALWSIGRANVREVRQFVAPSRALAYTTVMTVLDRLERRGIVSRTKQGRAFVYAPIVSRDAMRRLALKEFLDSYFESSQDQLLRFLKDEVPAVLPMTAASLDPVLL
ncbi:MAG: BlaI/MecI/CopY family transcriptional regulator [Bryobacteraceae bacterium]|jgi:BlaI family transcriptional regulator, penicillinase repressor